jgi:colanic acid biosynthesis glycosyl transferase WcaI
VNLKFLLISYNYYPEITGIGKYNTEFCEYLEKKGNNISVITANPYYPNWKVFKGYKNGWYKSEVINGVNILRCPMYIPLNPTGVKRILLDFSFYLSSLFVVLKHILLCQKYDIVFTPSPSFMIGFHGLLIKLFNRNTRFIYHIQDLQIDAALELGVIKQSCLKRILLDLEGFILKKAFVVSTISEGMRKKVLAKKKALRNVLVFPNWVDSNHVYVIKPNHDIVAELGIPLEKKIFFYSGSIGEKQGLEIILDLANEIKISNPDLFFVISGTGPYKQRLEAIAIEKSINNLLFIDLQPKPIFNQLLNFAFCHLVIQKGQASDLLLPSKLTNILAVGGLCIVTALPDTSLYDTIHEFNMGLVIPPENIGSLVTLVRNLDKGIVDVNTFKENALQYAYTYLDQINIIDHFLTEI